MRDGEIKAAGERVVRKIEKEAQSRSFRASNALRNASQFVLRGQRSGRRYRVAFTVTKDLELKRMRRSRQYTASAPGEPPAVRTGLLRKSWQINPRTEKKRFRTKMYASISSNVPYIKYLEPKLSGRKKGKVVKPRPFVKRIQQRAKPAIKRIYSKRYL